MEKSKQLLTKARNIIIFTSMVIFFIEANLFSFIRVFISNHITFFQNKGTLISNICLGVFGSAILTYVSEYCEYKSIKRKMRHDILRFCRKWKKEIELQTLDYIDNIEYVELIGEGIYQYWEEAYLLYNTYLPYNRNDSFVRIIRALYEYINEVKIYLDNKREIENINKNIKLLETLENKKTIESTLIVKEAIELNQKALQELYKVCESDEVIKKINDKMSALNGIISEADMFELVYVMTEAHSQDLRQDIINIENEITKQRIRHFFDIKRISRKIRYKYISLRYKK